jgi:hypothetical protein
VDEMTSGYKPVIEEICDLEWGALSRAELSGVAWAYYFFSVQFRESLEVALRLHPSDTQLKRLFKEECATKNLSPWPGVAMPDEQMNHDEFMRRVLLLSPIEASSQSTIEEAGRLYLAQTGQMDDCVKAMGIASYESGGLEVVFRSMLKARHWDTPLLQGFRHFLIKHIGFDSDPDEGHGALTQHFVPSDRIRPMWVAFRDLLITGVPRLAR